MIDDSTDTLRTPTTDESPAPEPAQAPPRRAWSEVLRDPRWWWQGIRSWALMIALVGIFSLVLGALRAPDLPEQAPDFALSTLDGETVRLSDFRGRTVVLNFWATWCPPCRMELPSFVRFARNNPEIVVLGLAVQSPPDALRSMVADQGIGYPILLADDSLSELYPVRTLPTTLVVGPDGRIEAAHSGLVFRPMLWWMTR